MFHSADFLGSDCGDCVCDPANHFLVGGNDEIWRIVVDLVLHRRVSGGERSGDLRDGDLRVDVIRPEHQVVLYNLHANVWWGAVLLILGLFFSLRFSPARERARMAGNS